MDAERIGVHAAHCCVKCGCKYRDDDCPVVNGEVAGIDCEECAEERRELVATLARLPEDEFAAIVAEAAQLRRARAAGADDVAAGQGGEDKERSYCAGCGKPHGGPRCEPVTPCHAYTKFPF